MSFATNFVSQFVNITIILGPFQPMPPIGHGAVEKVWHELAQEFVRAGHKVKMIGKQGSNPLSKTRATNDTDIELVHLPGFVATGRLWIDLVKDFAYALQVMRCVERSDAIVTNTFWLPTLLALFGRHLGKVIVHVARFPKGQMGLYRGADAIQAISSPVAQEIVQQTPALLHKVHVLPYPIDLAVYGSLTSLRSYHHELTVLYAGRVHPEKGIDLLIKAFGQVFKKIPRARLRIVGPFDREHGGGGETYLEELQSMAAGLPVKFVGSIREPVALAREYQQAHCFCYPSLAEKGEALGLAALEAMATGCPVVVSDLACFRDFVEPEHDGMIFDHRVLSPEHALGELLARILLHPELALQLGSNAADKARKFELANVAQRYLTFFNEIVHGKRSA